MPVADELVTILGVEVSKSAIAKLESFKNGVNSVKNTLMGLSVAITGFAATAGIMVKGASEEAAQLESLSSKTKMSTDALQEWGYAATKLGGDSKNLQGDLVKLQERFGYTGKDAESTLLRLSDRMKGMSDTRATQLGKSFGLSDDTINVLKKGREGIEDLRKEAHKLGGIIPQESIRRAADFKRQMAELQFAFHGITSQVAIALIPALSRVVETFKGWLTENREWISLGLEALMGGIVQGFERFWTVLKKIGGVFDPLIDMIKPFVGDLNLMEEVTHLVTGALTGLLFIFSPLIAKIALISAAVVGISWIFEDLFTYIEGGESVIGDLFNAFEERWPDLFSALQRVGQFIRENFIVVVEASWEVVKTVFGAIGSILETVLDGFNNLAGPVSSFFSTFEEKFPSLHKALQVLGDFIKIVLIGSFDAVVEGIKGALDFIFSALDAIGGGISKVMGGLNTAAEWFGFGGDDEKESKPSQKGSKPTAGAAEVPYQGAIQKLPASSVTPYRGQPAQVQASAQQGQTTIQNTDNRTLNQTVTTSDPVQAGQTAAEAFKGQPVGTPGSYAPAQ